MKISMYENLQVITEKELSLLISSVPVYKFRCLS